MDEILVTGATGALGRPLVERLRARGWVVRALSRHGEVRADLATGEGLDAAVAGVGVVVHLATSSDDPERTDVEGTRRLLAAAKRAGVGHFVYVSIVGIDRATSVAYFRIKRACEELVKEGGVPWTIMRATQFFELFPDRMFPQLSRLGPLVVGRGWRVQPVDVHDVADRLVQVVAEGPRGMLPDFGGPEVLSFGDIAREWKRAGGTRRPVWELPLPGKQSRAIRSGALLTPAHAEGKRRWSEWLAARYPA